MTGAVPTRTAIEKIEFSQTGFKRVKLAWDRSPDELIYLVDGQGEICFNPPLVDSGGDGTGDIIVVTDNTTMGDSYDITITLRLKD